MYLAGAECLDLSRLCVCKAHLDSLRVLDHLGKPLVGVGVCAHGGMLIGRIEVLPLKSDQFQGRCCCVAANYVQTPLAPFPAATAVMVAVQFLSSRKLINRSRPRYTQRLDLCVGRRAIEPLTSHPAKHR